MDAERADRTVATNRKARFDYFIVESLEVGIVLFGTEIKSVREGAVNLRDGYAKIEGNELWLCNVHISPYDKGGIYNRDPLRPRKLLIRKAQLWRLLSKTRERRFTLVPLKIYIKGGRWAKVELALAKGKLSGDKREDEAERDARREMDRARRRSLERETD